MIFIVVPSVALAFLVHHDFSASEVLWTFSVYLEAVAIIPQLQMIAQTGEAETITSHYLFFQGIYRYVNFAFSLFYGNASTYHRIQILLHYQLGLPVQKRGIFRQNCCRRRLRANRSIPRFLLALFHKR